MDLRDPAHSPDRVSTLRHDVMNPLTVILGYSQLLSIRKDLSDEARNQAARVFDETKRCIEIFEADKAKYEAVNDGFPFTPEEDVAMLSANSASVLIVDDDAGIRLLAREVIETGLAESRLFGEVFVCEASGRAQALERAEAICFDAILLDLNIDRPGGGLSLLAEIESKCPGIAAKTVFMSGGILDMESQHALENQKVPLLKKPFNIDELVVIIQGIIAN